MHFFRRLKNPKWAYIYAYIDDTEILVEFRVSMSDWKFFSTKRLQYNFSNLIIFHFWCNILIVRSSRLFDFINLLFVCSHTIKLQQVKLSFLLRQNYWQFFSLYAFFAFIHLADFISYLLIIVADLFDYFLIHLYSYLLLCSRWITAFVTKVAIKGNSCSFINHTFDFFRSGHDFFIVYGGKFIVNVA